MKNQVSRLIYGLSLFALVSSQQCDFGNIIRIRCGAPGERVDLQTQAQIDTFQKTLPEGCNCFMGNLRVQGNHQFDFTALDFLRALGAFTQSNNNSIGIQNGFNGLDTIYGDLVFESTELSDLAAFANLKYVGGDLRFSRVGGMNTLTGFQSLLTAKSVGINTTGFSEIAGFINCRTINQSLSIQENIQLKQISGFSNLKEVKNSIRINGNPAIESLAVFNQLRNGGNISVYNNVKLKDISGFRSVREVTALTIKDHSDLESISGFTRLSTITANGIVVSGNAGLKSIGGLKNLSSIRSSIEIKNNPKLTDCCAIYPALKADGPTTVKNIVNNGMNCNSVDEIIAGGSCK